MISQKVINAIERRSEGRCEAVTGIRGVGRRCWGIACEIHHMQYRSKCGTDDISNLIHLCHDCHYAIHFIPPSKAPWVMKYKRRYIKK